MTLQERADSYARAFPQFPASHLRVVEEGGGVCLYGTWVLGNDYRNKTEYYGAYPPGYLDRVMALFPDAGIAVLHVFSGSLPPSDQYERCDLIQPAEIQASVYDLPNIILNWVPNLVLADPPYSAADAAKYETAMVNRGRATRALSRVTRVGGHLVWLDTCWPMFSKSLWRTVGRITLIRSTNHRVRLISIFERQASPAAPLSHDARRDKSAGNSARGRGPADVKGRAS